MFYVTYALSPIAMQQQLQQAIDGFTELESTYRKENFWLLKVKSAKYVFIYDHMKKVEALLSECLALDSYNQHHQHLMQNSQINNTIANNQAKIIANSNLIGNLVNEWRMKLARI